MNLLFRQLDNANDPIWSVIISLIILLIGVTYYIYTILTDAFTEIENGKDDPAEQEVLLQLQSNRDSESVGR